MANTQPGDSDSPLLPDVLPVLPLKDIVLFPYIIVPLSIGPDQSVQAIDQALSRERLVMLVSQRKPSVDEPEPTDLYPVGTAGMIMRMLKLPDGRIRILVQGLRRARIEGFTQSKPFLQARISPIDEEEQEETNLETQALIRNVKENLEQTLQLGKGISPEVMVIAANLDDPGRLADLAASNLELEADEAQRALEELDPIRRLEMVDAHLHREIHILTLQHEISSQARGEIDRGQKEYFLRQQMKAIRQELGDAEDVREEVEAYLTLAAEKQLPKEARTELEKQLKRLEKSHPDSAESSVIRTYLDWITGLPWSQQSQDNLDLSHAQDVLDQDHYGLKKIKERIIEALAVRKLKPDSRGPILCFVGPPGVGKTSLGRSIAGALQRKFVRLSLGGVRDEAEIRGHRRTYIGSMPGRIIQGIHQAGTSNPVFMLDEIDKIGADYRGDPSSALLEVLDPEQNFSFRDHYLGVPYDLSKVIFITTANLLEPIQPAFLDRMEVLRLSGYTEEEKLEIAQRHLVPKQIEENGLARRHIQFTKAALTRLIRGYTQEAGLRNLERHIGAVCRKTAIKVARGEGKKSSISLRSLPTLLGPETNFEEVLLRQDKVGIATGLAWTAAGGDLMFIEALAVPGKGKLLLTGKLGEVMKESAQAALSYARSFAQAEGYSDSFFSENDLHVHVPAGAIPKDGPSAGITIATAIISVLTGIPIARKIAMTGEITLRGDLLPIGGLKEKALAARAAGVRRIIIPTINLRDLDELPNSLTNALLFDAKNHMREVLAEALTRPIASTKKRFRGARS